ncbi:MAG: glycosyltransferase family 9 protein [Terracidiphilus sp.]
MQRGKATNRLLDFYLGIPILNILASFRRRRNHIEHPGRIGLLFNPALGDTLLASAVTQEIRALFPWAEIVLFATNQNLAAAKLLPAINRIEILPITHPLAAIRALRRCALDWMLDFTSWQRITALYTLLSGARFTIGFERKGQYRQRGYDSTVTHRGDCHELENLRRLTRSLGATKYYPPRLAIPGGPLPEIVLRGGEVIVFHPWASGARSWLREWPDAHWAGLALRLRSPGRTFLITGSPADESRCKAMCQMILKQGASAEVMIGRNGIGEIARVLNHAEMLVSVNTGIMHLGAILGVPTVSINGPTAVHRWGPIGSRVANVAPSDGSGGFLDLGFEYGGHDENVMRKISVDEVMRAVHQLCGASIDAGSARDLQATRETADSQASTPERSQPRVPYFHLDEHQVELR